MATVETDETECCDNCGARLSIDDLYPCEECGEALCAVCDDTHACIADWEEDDWEEDDSADDDDDWELPRDPDAARAKLAAWNASVAAWNAAQAH